MNDGVTNVNDIGLVLFSNNNWWQQEHASHDVLSGFKMDAGMINALSYNKNWCIILILSVQIFV